MLRKKRYGMLAIVAFMMILLSGCFHVRQEVTLQAGDNWDALIEIRFPKSTVDQIGEEMLMESQSDFEAEQAEAAAKGVKATFDGRKENNGDVVWEITYSGQGLYLLNEVMFEGTPAFTADADGRVNFRYDASDITELTSMDGSYTFVLNAGAVYSSNATETKGNTLTWQDPTAPLQAEVDIASFSLWQISFQGIQEITLRANDHWDAVTEIRFPQEVVEQIGEQVLARGQEDLEDALAAAEDEGVETDFMVSKERNGAVVWKITYSGLGLDLLNETLFGDTAAFTAGTDDRVKFRYDADEIAEMISRGGSYTLVLKAGAVYSSNATETKGNTLTWQDPTARMRAEVGTRAVGGGLPSWLIIGVGIVLGIVLLAGLAVMLLYMRGKQMQQRGPSM